MKDNILKGYLKDFSEQHQINEADESKLFEYFCTYCIGARFYSDLGDLEDLIVGGGLDLSIDSIIISANGQIITNTELLEDIVNRQSQLDISFTFIQVKSGTKFKSGEIGNFLFGVKEFFTSEDTSTINSEVEEFKEIKESVYDNSINFSQNPKLKLYYITTGDWKDDDILLNRIESDVNKIKDTRLFSDVTFTPIDSDKIKHYYQELRRKITQEILLERYTILPEIEGIRQAYLGVLDCKEYLKLITDIDGNIQRWLFYENVRDFQGRNPVNQEINSTISDPDEQQKLAILNNGVTIVAQSINPVGNRIRVHDYQIVNGCQTSHILFQNRHKIGDKSHIPIKIIEAKDNELINQITQATNRQTEVKKEAFESLSNFHKNLEEFYSHGEFNVSLDLFYERRNRQYIGTPIKKYQIISMPVQLKCFIAVFLNEPHSTHRYYGELLDSYRSRVFQESHSLWPYYLSAVISKSIDRLIYERKLYNWVRPYNHQLSFSFRNIFGTPPPLKSDKKQRIYCQKILKFINKRNKSDQLFVDLAIKLSEVKNDLKHLQTKRAGLWSMKQFTEELSKRVRGIKVP